MWLLGKWTLSERQTISAHRGRPEVGDQGRNGEIDPFRTFDRLDLCRKIAYAPVGNIGQGKP